MENYLDFKYENDYNKLEQPANILKKGGLIVFPTETVYAIGANAFDGNAVKRIYIAKGRNFNNPINILVSSIDMVKSVTKSITPIENMLINAFFPGPFTIILHKNENIPNIVTANSDFVGVRMPDNIIAKQLIEFLNAPIAAPSANISGKTSGTSFNSVYEDFRDSVDFFIDGGNCNIGIESTIVKVIDEIPHILRPGSITSDQIQAITKTIVVKDYNTSHNSNLPSDNLLHYKLNSKSTVVYGKNYNELINRIRQIAFNYNNPIILCPDKSISKYFDYKTINIGKNFEEIAKKIFENLRKADTLNPDIVIIEGIKSEGIGEAIMNRLINSCDKYIEI